jgi:hypothetical protein
MRPGPPMLNAMTLEMGAPPFEIMSDLAAQNPLLDTTGLPRFSDISPEHVSPAIEALLAEADAALALVTSDAVPADYDTLSRVLDVATERLGRAWGAVGHCVPLTPPTCPRSPIFTPGWAPMSGSTPSTKP